VGFQQIVKREVQRVGNEEHNLMVLECRRLELKVLLFLFAWMNAVRIKSSSLLNLDDRSGNHRSARVTDVSKSLGK
jgi:hypothetical protein